MNKKIIFNGVSDYGTVGDDFGDDILRIGDIVSFMYNKRIYSGVIVQPDNQPNPIVMGFGTIDFDTLFKEGYSVVVKASNVTTELIQFLNGSKLEIREEEPVDLTLRDLEVILGYPVNIIEFSPEEPIEPEEPVESIENK